MPIRKDRRAGRSRIGIATQLDLEDRSSALVPIDLKAWAAMSREMRIEQLQSCNERYHGILDELYVSANLCVERYQASSKAHTKWRWTLILGTGVMAIINVLAAYARAQHPASTWLAVVAA